MDYQNKKKRQKSLKMNYDLLNKAKVHQIFIKKFINS